MKNGMMMARKFAAAEAAFSWLNRGMMKKVFFAHHLRGQNHLEHLDRALPVIFYSNHSCRWDGLLAFHLSYDILRHDGILMMDRDQLASKPFYRWIGAFSVDRANGETAKRSLDYGVQQIKRGRSLWMYPQGVMLANDVRPIHFYHGMSYIIEQLGPVQAVPVVHRYEFIDQHKPEAFTSIGPVKKIEGAEKANRKELTRELQGILICELNALRDDVIERRLGGFSVTNRSSDGTPRRGVKPQPHLPHAGRV